MKRALLGIFVLTLLINSVGCCNRIWRRNCSGCGDVYMGDWHESPAQCDGCGSHCGTCRNLCDPCCRPILGWWQRLLADFEQPYCGRCRGRGCDSCGGGCSSYGGCASCAMGHGGHSMPGEVIHEHSNMPPYPQDDQPTPMIPKERVAPPPIPPQANPAIRPMPEPSTRVIKSTPTPARR